MKTKGHEVMEKQIVNTEMPMIEPIIACGAFSGLGKLENVIAQRSTEGPSQAMLDGARSLILGIGEDPDREGLLDTPKRVANMLREVTSGYVVDLEAIINGALFEEAYDEPITIKDMTFYSLCEHHMLPFYGKAHVAYIPNGRVVGLSKIPRVVEAFSRRLQVQERLTSQIADYLEQKLEPQGVAVVLEGVHLCAVMRGVSQPTGVMRTRALRGSFRGDPELVASVLGV
jgi:GTP cyclohydrolase I